MAERDIASTDYGDMTNTVTDFSVDPQQTDGATGDKVTRWTNTEWSQQLGYYKQIPELRVAVDALARWTIGKGFKSNEITEMLLMNFKGHGKDTFNSILENQTRVSKIAGDSYAEIVRFSDLLSKIKSLFRKDNRLVNLKPLDPGTITILANSKGIITGYEQNSKVPGGAKKTFKPHEIFHLSRNRVADEIHGTSLIEAIKEIILMRNEAMADMKELLHRYVKPRFFFHLDTDDATEIATFKAKCDAAVEYGENVYIPKDAVKPELLSVAPNATLNPLPWIQMLNNNFYQAAGVPQIVVGGSQEFTEATAKIAYFAFEQTIEEEQLYLEEQVLAQLNLEIELEFPATLQNDLISDKAKSETMQAATPEDTAVTAGGIE